VDNWRKSLFVSVVPKANVQTLFEGRSPLNRPEQKAKQLQVAPHMVVIEHSKLPGYIACADGSMTIEISNGDGQVRSSPYYRNDFDIATNIITTFRCQTPPPTCHFGIWT
jgi:hypothetical protein